MLDGDSVFVLIFDTRCHHSDPEGHDVPTLSDMKGPFDAVCDAYGWLERNHFRRCSRPTTHFGLDRETSHPLRFSYKPPAPDHWDEELDGPYDWGDGCYGRYAQIVPALGGFTSPSGTSDL